MTPEHMDQALELACGSPRYTDLCLAITFLERDRAKGNEPSNQRYEQIGRLLIDVLEDKP